MKNILSFCLLYCTCAVVAVAQPQPLSWIGDAPSRDCPVSFGIPFNKGELKSGYTVALSDGQGQTIPSDCWPMAYWPDGSIKWAAMAAVVKQGTGVPAFAVVPAKTVCKHSLSETVHVTRVPGYVKISTGRLRAYLPVTGCNLIDSILLDGRKVGGTALLRCTTQDHAAADDTQEMRYDSYHSSVDSLTVERVGNVRALVRINGKYVNEAGRAWLPFCVRLYFYAGSDQIKVVHSFIYDGDMNRDFIQSLGLQVEVPMRAEWYNRHVAFATDGGGVWAEPVQPLSGRRILTLDNDKSWQERQMRGERIPAPEAFDEKNRRLLQHWAAWGSFRLSQTTADAYSIRKRTRQGCPWIGTMGGHRAPGYAFVGDVDGGMGVWLKDFWQSCPTALQVDSACTSHALLTLWLWSPDAPAMDLRHYDVMAHDLEASYEDVQEGMSTPYGVARTHTLMLLPQAGYGGKAQVAATAQALEQGEVLLPTPQYLHQRKAFGVWSLPDTTNARRARVEQRLNDYLDYYLGAVDQHRWYGFWNYGDFMHTYDAVRHEWKYDVGGYAWDTPELPSNTRLCHSSLPTGPAALSRRAEAMSRHTPECDVYHLGPYAGLGSRHNVSHWGCGAKEARISQAAWNRFYYYLTTDERTGDLMDEVRDADQMLYTIDPMRLALPRSEYPCSAPARLRVGPDWLAYAGNWMTYWERTRDKSYRNKIVTGMKSIAALPCGLFTGPGVLGFDPATGKVSYEGDPALEHTNHLMTIMGGFQMMNEMMEMIEVPAWNKAWLYHAANYREKAHQITRNRFPVTRLKAYAAAQTGNKEWAREAWQELWSVWHNDGPFTVTRLTPPEVPAPIDENPKVCTNDAATWSLAAIYMQEVIPQD